MNKKILLTILLFAIVFSMAACSKKEVIGNDDVSPISTEMPTEVPKPIETQTTEATIPKPTEVPAPMPTLEPTEEPTLVPTPEPTEVPKPTPMPEIKLKLELKDTDHSRIMEILDFSGRYTDSVNNEGGYSYQIPQFRADSDSAKNLNQRIVDDILPYVEEEIGRMSGGSSLLHYGIHYEITEFEDITSILIKIPYPNDGLEFYVYNYDFAKDMELTNAEILAKKDMTEEAFMEAAYKLQKEDLDRFYDRIHDESKEEYLVLLKEANELTKVDTPMYLDEDGTLNAIVFYVDGTGEIRGRFFEFQ